MTPPETDDNAHASAPLLREIEEAADRIRGYVRRTPVIEAEQVRDPPVPNPLSLKLECLQVTGSFKARGAMNRLLSSDPASLSRGIVTASGGNHGLGVARAGLVFGIPTTIYLPPNASRAKIRALADWNAEVHVVGERWDDADAAATAHAEREGAVYFHPFKDRAVMAGQGTAALEMLEDGPPADVYVVAIGGGGLIASLSTVIRARNPAARIVGVEPTGSPTLRASLEAGEVVSLERVTTRVATMSCGRTDPGVFDIVRRNVDRVVLVDDGDMETAARWIWTEFALRADMSAAAAIAALRLGKVPLAEGERVAALICGADDAVLSDQV